MKRLAVLLVVINLFQLFPASLKAQYVTLPDTNFVNALINYGYGSCLNGNQLDTTCSLILAASGFNVPSANLHDLTGIQYFKNLTVLVVEDNQLSTLSVLPSKLTSLYCGNNNLTFLPGLPDSLKRLECYSNQLNSLPVLPSKLRILECGNNQLSSLPALPSSVEELAIYRNNFAMMPALPSGLKILICGFNPMSSITTLPVSLTEFYCDSAVQSVLPALPPNLQVLSCSENLLSSLPGLPASLVSMDCSHNQLTSLPILPSGISDLKCTNNLLTALPALPDTMYNLWISDNPGLTCLPPIACIGCENGGEFLWYNTGIECLPNACAMGNQVPSINLPICDVINVHGCAVNWNLKGTVANDLNGNCFYDSMEPAFGKIKVNLFKSGNLVQQTYTNGNGEYSFATDTGNFVCVLDTVGTDYSIQCPLAFSYSANISSPATYYDSLDFALTCKPGFNVGVSSLELDSGIFRPANWAEVTVLAGDFSSQYNLDCASGISGTVTVVIQGPASFSGAGTGALVPVVNNDTLIYTIPDFGAVNYYNDFRFLVQTDTLAQIGDQVCFDVIVTPVVGDYNPGNNYYSQCFAVVNSYDPNDKQVSPCGITDTSQYWLTYTVRFQNTGNAMAKHVYILDTLDLNIDESSIQLLAYSHEPLVQVIGNVVKFNFPNINLPDSVNNEPASHGYVQYKVKRLEQLSIGTQIRNTAYIYFDFNPPVQTNTTVNTISANGTVGMQEHLNTVDMTLFPNPISSGLKLNLILNKIVTGPGTIALFEPGGRRVYFERIDPASEAQQITIPDLASGIYFVQFENGTTRIQRKLVVVK